MLTETVKALRHRYILPIGILFLLVAVGRIIFGSYTAKGFSYTEHGRRITAFVLVKGISGMLFWSWILYRKRSGEHLSTFTILLSLFNLVWMILGTVWLFDTHHQHRDNYTIISTLQTVTVADWTLFTFYLCFVFLKFLREYCYCPCGGICMLAAVGRITFGILIICGLFDQLPFKDNGRYITAFVLVKGVTGVLFWSWLLHRYIHKKEEKHLSTFTLLLSIFNFIWMIIGTALVFDVSHLQREHFSVKSVLQVITIVDWALFGFYVCFVFMQTLRAIWKYRNTDH